MKIIINYDLLERAAEAKHKFSLVKETKRAVKFCAFFYSVIWTPYCAITKDPISFSHYLNTLPFNLLLSTGMITLFYSFNTYFKGVSDLAFLDLHILSKKLESLNINTNGDLLMDAYKYKTEYEIDSHSKIPLLVQKKYINIPSNDDKEVSLLQEHVIGSHTYTLSKGKPSKQMAFKPAFSH
ncbi:MAG: hypothetical protein HFH45_05600 [Bacilli bacterium]|nr:hypothetical protein [Bacilli bacterium]